MALLVKVTAEAERDLFAIADWLVLQHAGEGGLRWLDNLETAMQSLTEQPHRCPMAPEATAFHMDVRQLVYGRKPNLYRILYVIEGDQVVILHIVHGRRLPLGAR